MIVNIVCYTLRHTEYPVYTKTQKRDKYVVDTTFVAIVEH